MYQVTITTTEDLPDKRRNTLTRHEMFDNRPTTEQLEDVRRRQVHEHKSLYNNRMPSIDISVKETDGDSDHSWIS